MNQTLGRLFTDMPQSVALLPRNERGFPVPFFAEEVDGKPDFRVVSPDKMRRAIKQSLCWVCGGKLGSYKAFVIGPMCAINRTISDPPSHRGCAIFSARNCPFLSRPLAKRRTDGLPDNVQDAAGMGLKRNPGAVGVWITKAFEVFRPDRGNPGILFSLGDPTQVLWFANGQPATRAEVQASIDSGLPSLHELALLDGPAGVRALVRAAARITPLLPA